MNARLIPFSIAVSGAIRLNGSEVVIIVERTETTVSLSPEITATRGGLGPGITTYDVILEAARELIRRKTYNRFSAADLYSVALEKYPGLRRGSFMARVIACTPDHPSYKHHQSRRDYFSHIGPGLYWLNEQYTADRITDRHGGIGIDEI